MNESMPFQSSRQNGDRIKATTAILIAIATILWHVLLIAIPWDEWLTLSRRTPTLPPRVEIKNYDPKDLEKLKQAWKKEKSLLLSNSPADSSESNPNARFMSDQTRKFERERRARMTQVMPTPQEGTMDPDSNANLESKPKVDPMRREYQVPMSSFGIPFRIGDRKLEKEAQKTAEERYQETKNRYGGDQAVLDRDLPEDARNYLNSEKSVYYSFYSRIYEAIGPVWQSNIRTLSDNANFPEGEYTTRVDVVMDSEGRLVAVNYLSRSGIGEIDQVVEDSWRKISRFPNPPRDLLDSHGQLHTSWTFNLSINEQMGGLRSGYQRNR